MKYSVLGVWDLTVWGLEPKSFGGALGGGLDRTR